MISVDAEFAGIWEIGTEFQEERPEIDVHA
jgi:hypothetical protein